MALRETVTHFGGASASLQPNGVYIGMITAVLPNRTAKVRISSLGIVVGPCRSVDGISLTKGGQVVCTFLNARLGEMVIIGAASGAGGAAGNSYSSVSTIVDAAYTLVLEDVNRFINVDVSSAAQISIPNDSILDFPVGSAIGVHQGGAGQVSIIGDTGVTVNCAGDPTTSAQFSVISLVKVSANCWTVTGDNTNPENNPLTLISVFYNFR